MKIAIVKLSALGDIVHSMLVLQFIKKKYTDIEIDWIVDKSFEGVMDFNPDINKVHFINLKKAKLNKSLHLIFKELKRIRGFGPYDLVIDLQGLVKSAFISRLIASDLTIGFDKSSLRESCASMFYNRVFKYGYEKNIIERNLALAAFALDFNFSNKEIDLKNHFLFSSKKYFFEDISLEKKNIIFVLGASYKTKCYPIQKIAQIVKKINENILVIWGNDEEKKMAYKLKNLAPSVNVLGKLSLDELISLIGQVDIVIGPDTGPTHMAWALNTASITLFGPTPGYRNTRITDINKIIESKSVVNPKKINKKDDSIKDIKISSVLDLMKKLLD